MVSEEMYLVGLRQISPIDTIQEEHVGSSLKPEAFSPSAHGF